MPHWVNILIICIGIFLCRIVDVSLGTIRMIVSVKGRPGIAAFVGFFEVLAWFLIAREAINADIFTLWVGISYAGGFAAGTFIGGMLAKRFIRSLIEVQVITSAVNKPLAARLREAGYAVSVLNVESSEYSDEKIMILSDIKSDMFPAFRKLVTEYDEKAFIIVRESKMVVNGFFRKSTTPSR